MMLKMASSGQLLLVLPGASSNRFREDEHVDKDNYQTLAGIVGTAFATFLTTLFGIKYNASRKTGKPVSFSQAFEKVQADVSQLKAHFSQMKAVTLEGQGGIVERLNAVEQQRERDFEATQRHLARISNGMNQIQMALEALREQKFGGQ